MTREPPLLWVISRRADCGVEVYLTGSRSDGTPLWSQWWTNALRYATAAKALEALRAHTPLGMRCDWRITRMHERCARTRA